MYGYKAYYAMDSLAATPANASINRKIASYRLIPIPGDRRQYVHGGGELLRRGVGVAQTQGIVGCEIVDVARIKQYAAFRGLLNRRFMRIERSKVSQM